jgi:hypothetical protein
MSVTTPYGTWNNHGDRYELTVGASVANAISGGDSDWTTRVMDGGHFDSMVSDYRDAINSALPDSVSLCGDEFIGPYRPDEDEWAGYPTDEYNSLDIHAIVESVDLNKIVERHDPDNA